MNAEDAPQIDDHTASATTDIYKDPEKEKEEGEDSAHNVIVLETRETAKEQTTNGHEHSFVPEASGTQEKTESANISTNVVADLDDDEWGDFKTDKDTVQDAPEMEKNPDTREDWGAFSGNSQTQEERERLLESKIPRVFFEGEKEEIDEAIKWVFEKVFPTPLYNGEMNLGQAPDLEEMVVNSEFSADKRLLITPQQPKVLGRDTMLSILGIDDQEIGEQDQVKTTGAVRRGRRGSIPREVGGEKEAKSKEPKDLDLHLEDLLEKAKPKTSTGLFGGMLGIYSSPTSPPQQHRNGTSHNT